MEFGKALELIRSGKRVRRAIWANRQLSIGYDESKPLGFSMYHMGKPHGTMLDITGQALMATDWEEYLTDWEIYSTGVLDPRD